MTSYIEKRGRKTFLVTPAKLSSGSLTAGQSLRAKRKRLTPAEVLIAEAEINKKDEHEERAHHKEGLKKKLVYAGFKKI